MKIKAAQFKNEKAVKVQYKFSMRKGKHVFFDLVKKVEEMDQLNQIFSLQIGRFQLQHCKVQGMDCETIRNLYESVQLKYYETCELTKAGHFWNDCQKKLFIWFIIFYTYLNPSQALQDNRDTWKDISCIFFDKEPEFLQFTYLSMVKAQGKCVWSTEEDAILTEAVAQTPQAGKWNETAKYLFYQSEYRFYKSPKQCRERWFNHLDDKKKRGEWLLEEDLAILRFVLENGKRWCKMVPILKDVRTEHMIKNRYNSMISRQKNNKCEREESMIQKIIRKIKKQLANLQKKKLKKQEIVQPHSENNGSKKETTSMEMEDVQNNLLIKIEDEQIVRQSPSPLQNTDLDLKEDQQKPEESLNSIVKKEIQYVKQEGELEDNNKIQNRSNPIEHMPFYGFDQKLIEYPFLYQQQMEMMRFYQSFGYYRPYF